MRIRRPIRLQPWCLHPIAELRTFSISERGPNGEQLLRVFRRCLECERVDKANSAATVAA
jgi:hypothetical protein